ncbi:MAG: CBS domain-containing protein [Actinobacteria bacterium]|nr:CBS domain-containing protein [Actinomycetota bacterium]NBY05896.1 CBS domain-containing protein [Betaproteobacteria bacterium]
MHEKTVNTILKEQWTAKESETCGVLIEKIRGDENVQIIPIVDDSGAPVGLVEKANALKMMSNPLHYSVCERRSVRMMMLDDFIVVEHTETISNVSSTIINHGFGLNSGGFIVTENGVYKGIGLSTDLLYYLVESNEQKAKELAEINSEMLDSVRYASRIQQGLLPGIDVLETNVKSVGLIWEPRDIVGGDVYWCHISDDAQKIYLALIDCTGHGVPGSLMSMLVISSFNRVFAEFPDISPALALAKVGDMVRSALNQDKEDCESNDGFDAGICLLDRSSGNFIFAGARTNCYVVPTSDEAIVRLVADKQVLGYPGTQPHKTVDEFQMRISDCASFVMASDGIFDQPGHALGRAFGPKRFTETIEEFRTHNASDLIKKLSQRVTEWRGSEVRRDDLSAIAVTI